MQIIPEKQAEYDNYKQISSDDAYSNRVVTYGEQWADLMEAEIAAGKKLEDVADQTSHDADTDGITGYMHSVAAAALAHFWVHGEQLRRWHNLKTQIGNEGEKANESGGILNSAIVHMKD